MTSTNKGKSNHSKRLMQSLFLVPTKEQVEMRERLDKELHSETNFYRKAAQKIEDFEVESNSLVKSCESPTKANPSSFTEINALKRADTARKNKARKRTKAKQKFSVWGRDNEIRAYSLKQFRENFVGCPEPISLESRKTYTNKDYLESLAQPQNSLSADSKVVVRLYNQDWSGKYRFGLETGALGARIAPPETNGERKTDELTKNATKNILESGAYLSACRGGYTTFLTLTFDDEAREKLTNEETTIGKEVSRFFDGAQKAYQRGMNLTYWEDGTGDFIDYDGKGKKVSFSLPMICPELVYPRLPTGEIKQIPTLEECEPYNFRKHIECDYLEEDAVYGQTDYMWVAECPLNDDGEPNPHVHIMMRWNVEKKHFRAWAERLEELWGHGFAKLERIKTPQAASNYLLKAVGYMTKGAKENQGTIKGNRYNISASARAPKWECIGEFFADNFLAILGELREKLQRKKAKILSQKIACTQEHDWTKAEISKQTNINKKSFSDKRLAYIESLKKSLLDGDKAIKECGNQLGELPFINEFAIGNLDQKQADSFLHWAMRERFWNNGVENNEQAKFSRLKQQTADAVRNLRSHWRMAEHLMFTQELTWQWAEHDSNFEAVCTKQNLILDEKGNQWELVV